MYELLDILCSLGIKVRIEYRLCEIYDKIILFFDRRDVLIHFVDFIWIKAESIAAIDKGIGMDCFFVCLAQEILACFRVGDMAIDRKYEVVCREALSSREEP